MFFLVASADGHDSVHPVNSSYSWYCRLYVLLACMADSLIGWLHSRLVLTEWAQDTVGMPFINNFSQRHWGSVSLFRRETENNLTVSISVFRTCYTLVHFVHTVQMLHPYYPIRCGETRLIGIISGQSNQKQSKLHTSLPYMGSNFDCCGQNIPVCHASRKTLFCYPPLHSLGSLERNGMPVPT